MIKNIVAKELLIVFSFIIVFTSGVILNNITPHLTILGYWVVNMGVFGYPVFLIFRLVRWAWNTVHLK
jgi:hypothetical protein